MEPQSIKAILQSVINRAGMDDKIEEYKALLVWYDVAPSLAARAEPVEMSRGRMIVNVTDSVILHQLTFYKREYIDKINLMLGKCVVKDIVFRVGKVEVKNPESPGEQAGESRDDYIERLRGVQLDQDELTRIDEITAQVEDQEIQDSLRELFISQSKLSKVRNDES